MGEARVWLISEPPDESVRAVQTRHGTIFLRHGEGWTSLARTDGERGGLMTTWCELLQDAPLADVTDEIYVPNQAGRNV
jgi:hypothetical protein